MVPTTFDITAIREQFPILKTTIHGKPIVYLDNAASTQKPLRVMEATTKYYSEQYANIHRGVHTLSQIGTELYENTRLHAQQFLHARSEKEIIFTKGTTHGINLIAYSYAYQYLKSGDEIILSEMEHHSNIVPWQILQARHGFDIKVIPLQDNGTIEIEDFASLLTEKTKLVSISYISNALGTVNPIREIIQLAHENGTHVLVDAAQAVHHIPIDVQALDVDFLVCSGHKMYGPTGTGILYGKESLLEALPPFEGGGDMIKQVSFKKTTFNDLPFKFEAGTPNIAGIVALDEAFKFLDAVGFEQLVQHDQEILSYATEKLLSIDGMRIIGTAPEKVGVVSFLLGNLHPYDVGVILDNLGIAIRTGHHCTQPIMDRFGIPGTCRASFGIYTTKEEIDSLYNGLLRAKKMLS
ncbi:MAG: cysteine desulfurase [Chitinophagales bacterium]|nr:cysteine desulfurase [Chitinophagales bacterium]